MLGVLEMHLSSTRLHSMRFTCSRSAYAARCLATRPHKHRVAMDGPSWTTLAAAPRPQHHGAYMDCMSIHSLRTAMTCLAASTFCYVSASIASALDSAAQATLRSNDALDAALLKPPWHAAPLWRSAAPTPCSAGELLCQLDAAPLKPHRIVLCLIRARHAAGGKSAAELNEEYAQRCGSAALPAQLAVAKAQLLLEPDAPARAAERLTACDLASVSNTAAEAAAAHAWLQEHAPDAAQTFAAAAREVHRWSATFDGPDRLPLPPDDGLSEKLQGLALLPTPATNGSAEREVVA